MRGAFLSGGSVTDPQKRYHLELATSHVQAGREVEALLRDMGFEPKNVMRQNNLITYFKSSTHIEDLLTLIGAPGRALEIMSAKAATFDPPLTKSCLNHRIRKLMEITRALKE